tara:strand:- start:1214 stop:1534 length:321 start_codon:yes stop_codon:yes gene_type:complete
MKFIKDFIEWFFHIESDPKIARLKYQIDNYKPEIITLGGYDNWRDAPLYYYCTYRSCCGRFKWTEAFPIQQPLMDAYSFYGKRLYYGWRIEKLTTEFEGEKKEYIL